MIESAVATVLTASAGFALVYFLVVNGTYTVQLFLASAELVTRRVRMDLEPFDWWQRTPDAPRVTVVAPAYAEEVTIVASVEGMLTLEYPDLEVVVVNDGSPDGTLDVLRDAFDLAPDPHAPTELGILPSQPIRRVYRSRLHDHLVVVDKDNGGKADALNAGLGVASGDLFIALDADTIVAPDALLRMSRAFLEQPGVLAVGGTIRPVNGDDVADGRVVSRGIDRTWFGSTQSVEYLRAFLIGRLGWNRLGGNVIISGAFGAFHRASAIAAGGYEHGSIGEDFELVVRMRRRGYDEGGSHGVVFLPDPVAFTEAPTSRRVLRVQRMRWHRGLLDTLWRHRDAVFRPRYRGLGFGGLGFFTAVEAVGPVVEGLGLLALLLGVPLGLVDPTFAMLYLTVAYLWGAGLSVWSTVLDAWMFPPELTARDRFHQLVAALAEPFWFRPMTVWWRLRATAKWLRRGQAEWGAMTRSGFRGSSAPGDASP